MEEKEVRQNRHIEISVVSIKEPTVTFRISRQTHRGEEFTPNGREFKSSYGYFLVSQGCPEYKECRDLLYVRGVDDYEDDSPVTVPLLHFAKIMQAVTEYNQTNGAGYEKPWPQNGDKYLCIDSAGCINEYDYDNDYMDEVRREFGNFFRTREEAEAASERVRKALKGDD